MSDVAMNVVIGGDAEGAVKATTAAAKGLEDVAVAAGEVPVVANAAADSIDKLAKNTNALTNAVQSMHDSTRAASRGIMAMSLVMGESQNEGAKTFREISHLATAFVLGGPLVGGIIATVVVIGKLKEAMDEAGAASHTFDDAVKGIGGSIEARGSAGIEIMRANLLKLKTDLVNFGLTAGEISKKMAEFEQAQAAIAVVRLNAALMNEKAHLADVLKTVAAGSQPTWENGNFSLAAGKKKYEAATQESGDVIELIAANEKRLTQAKVQLALTDETVKKADEYAQKEYAVSDKAKFLVEMQLKLTRATEDWASAMGEVVSQQQLLGGIKPGVDAPSNAVMANGGLSLAGGANFGGNGFGRTFDDMHAALGVGVARPQLDAYAPTNQLDEVTTATAAEMKEFSDVTDGTITVIRDTKGSLADMARQTVENIGVSASWQAGIESANDAIRIAFDPSNLAKTVGDFAKAVAGGHGGGAAGSAVGGIIGGIVDTASGGATGGMGAALGSILGGIFGDALDKLVNSLHVLTPLFDAVSDIIASLTPVLVPLHHAFEGIKTIIDIGLAGPLLHLADPIGKVVQVIAELVIAGAPWIGLVLDLVTSTLLLTPVFDLLTTPMKRLATVTGNLISGSEHLFNAFVIMNNGLIEQVRSININGVQPFKDFGELMQQINPDARPLCFVRGTMTATPDGSVAIEAIKIGDEVIAHVEANGDKVARKVTKLHSGIVTETVIVEAGGGVIEVTAAHRFLVVRGSTTAWVFASALSVGDELVGLDGHPVFVTGVALRDDAEGIEVFNLEVDEVHTFHVGNPAVVVHNGDKKKEELAAAKETAKNTAALVAQQNNLPPGWKGLAGAAFGAAPAIIIIHPGQLQSTLGKLGYMSRYNSIASVISSRGAGDRKG